MAGGSALAGLFFVFYVRQLVCTTDQVRKAWSWQAGREIVPLGWSVCITAVHSVAWQETSETGEPLLWQYRLLRELSQNALVCLTLQTEMCVGTGSLIIGRGSLLYCASGNPWKASPTVV